MTSSHFEQRTAETIDTWYTPEWVLDLVRQGFGGITLDPATDASNPTRALLALTEADNGLAHDWDELLPYKYGSVVWINPPYGRALLPWARKIVGEAPALRNHHMFVLVPSRTETEWFGTLFDSADAIAFFRDRIRFWHPWKTGKDSPAFPNALFYFGSSPGMFEAVFRDAARVVKLK